MTELERRALEMLQSVQWSDSINWGATAACPSCREPKKHANWCELAELIRDLEKADTGS